MLNLLIVKTIETTQRRQLASLWSFYYLLQCMDSVQDTAHNLSVFIHNFEISYLNFRFRVPKDVSDAKGE